MTTEIEAKFPNVDTDDLRARLKALGGVLVHPERFMRRKNFDRTDRSLQKVGGWIRVRDEGEKVTLSYKQVENRTLHGTKEVSIDVGDFNATCVFLEATGFHEKAYQETKREAWRLGDADVTIDTWPWVPSFVEIEGPSEANVKDAAAQLGFEWKNAMHGSVETVYQMHYDFTEEEIDSWTSVTFIPEPEWLLAKKKS